MSIYLENHREAGNYQKVIHQRQLASLQDDSTIVSEKWLKNAIWAYFLLLILEGALRKWVLPGLATPLLLIRDPFAIWLVGMAWYRNLLPFSIYLIGSVLIGVLSIFTATFLGHGNLPVALYGARILLVHFPLMFAIGQILTKEDVIQIGKVTLLLAIPMTALTALQFFSPQTAFVNRGVGGDLAGGGFDGVNEFRRPPGTFSFTNGLSCFYGFTAAYIFYFWLDPKRINRLLLLAGTGALLIAIPLSISRGLFFQVGVSILFVAMIASHSPKYIGKLILAVFGILICLVVASQADFFKTAIDAFVARFEFANENEGGLEGVLLDRYLGGLVESLMGGNAVPFWGWGAGKGTNVGSMLLVGDKTFLISEGEWGRLIGEMGPLLGIGMIFIRLAFSAKLVFASFKTSMTGNILPWMLVSYGLMIIPQGQWAQPTSLGFSTLIGGLIIASFNTFPSRGRLPNPHP